MDVVNLLIGGAIGFAGGFVVKGQSSKSESVSSSGIPYSTLYNEAQAEISKLKLELRTRDSEIDELNKRIKNLTRKIRNEEDKVDDRNDNIEDMKKMINSLRRQNEDLNEKVTDYKSLYTAAQQEIERLKG